MVDACLEEMQRLAREEDALRLQHREANAARLRGLLDECGIVQRLHQLDSICLRILENFCSGNDLDCSYLNVRSMRQQSLLGFAAPVAPFPPSIRPNCVRELRWALDFERAGHLRVALLSMHPAVTFDGRVQLVQDGPLQGLVFSSKEKKVKRVCPEALALVKRLNDVHMNMLPWHELQAWRSDEKKGDWERRGQRWPVRSGQARL